MRTEEEYLKLENENESLKNEIEVLKFRLREKEEPLRFVPSSSLSVPGSGRLGIVELGKLSEKLQDYGLEIYDKNGTLISGKGYFSCEVN